MEGIEQTLEAPLRQIKDKRIQLCRVLSDSHIHVLFRSSVQCCWNFTLTAF